MNYSNKGYTRAQFPKGVYMIPGDFIKHKRFMDVCVKIYSATPKDDLISIFGVFWNQGYVESYMIGKHTNFDIKKSQLNDWEILDKNCKHDKCFRYSNWITLK